MRATAKKSPNSPPKKPERFKVEEVAEALRAGRGFVSVTARKLACDPATIYDYMDRYPELRIIRRDAKEEEKDVAEEQLGKAIRSGEAWAICFFLKTQAKDRGYVERSEVTLSKPTTQLTDEQLRRLAESPNLTQEEYERIVSGTNIVDVLREGKAGEPMTGPVN